VFCRRGDFGGEEKDFLLYLLWEEKMMLQKAELAGRRDPFSSKRDDFGGEEKDFLLYLLWEEKMMLQKAEAGGRRDPFSSKRKRRRIHPR
jgi:hypothetical protein